MARALETIDGKAPKNDEIDRSLERARIVHNSKLQPQHEWLQQKVDAFRGTHASVDGVAQPKRILLLGSGLVAGPAVDIFLKRPDVRLIIGM